MISTLRTITPLLLLFLAPLASQALAAFPSESGERPNIVIIYSDDQGYADLGIQGVLDDVKTPHLDALARDGVRFTSGYITAPQCSPSRAGLLTGRYQQRFGYDDISQGPLPLDETTIADRLKAAGYVTGMVGKWHLKPDNSHGAFIRRNRDRLVKEPGKRWEFPDEVVLPYMPEGRGFDEFFEGWNTERECRINFRPDGKGPLDEALWTVPGGFRTDQHNAAALDFIARHAGEKPFFLYLAHSIPHVPLEAPEKYLDRFTGDMPERRRYALAMMAAMDDGVGAIVDLLKKKGAYDNTLIFFASDNGAPLKMTMPDRRPIGMGGPNWDGSRNDPMNGEKGMLSEGGIRVPFIATWPGVFPAGRVEDEPVIALDIGATAVAAAGLPVDETLDGIDLRPWLSDETSAAPERKLFWRFWTQSAIRSGNWKFLKVGSTAEYLFDLEKDPAEKTNRIETHPEKAAALRAALEDWAASMAPPGLPGRPARGVERSWYEFYLGLPGAGTE